jgi:hypothetical protein
MCSTDTHSSHNTHHPMVHIIHRTCSTHRPHPPYTLIHSSQHTAHCTHDPLLRTDCVEHERQTDGAGLGQRFEVFLKRHWGYTAHTEGHDPHPALQKEAGRNVCSAYACIHELYTLTCLYVQVRIQMHTTHTHTSLPVCVEIGAHVQDELGHEVRNDDQIRLSARWIGLETE